MIRYAKAALIAMSFVSPTTIDAQQVFSNGFEVGHAGAWSTIVGGVTTVSVESSPTSLTGLIDQTVNISTTVSVATAHPGPFTVNLSQLPLPGGPLAVSPALPTLVVASATSAVVFSQELTPTLAQEFEITTTATIAQTGGSDQVTVVLNAVDSLNDVALTTPGSDPSVLLPNTITNVTFAVAANSFDPGDPPEVSLHQDASSEPLTQLNDNGADGDLVAADGVYGGTAAITTVGLSAGDCLAIHASAGESASPTYDLCVSGFPPVGPPSDLGNAFDDTENGGKVVHNEVIVKFTAGTTETRMAQIALGVGGTIVGSLPGLGFFRILLFPAPATLAALNGIIDTLSGVAEVELALANGAVTIDSFPRRAQESSAFAPSDPYLPAQNYVPQIRADEAWAIARGGTLIAIIDTGIDPGHPDLAGKIILGPDLVNDDADPRDGQGHGTAVAGVAAATGNNGTGIAGIAFTSPIYVVKVNNDEAPTSTGTSWHQSWGIADAANKGARVINTSFGGFAGVPVLISPTALPFCTAVNWAWSKGALVVAAAGNENSSSEHYPAACARALAVGGTTSSDSRWASSNYGSWVDIAAPSENILTTTPTYAVSGNSVPPPLGIEMNYDFNGDGTSLAAPIVAGAAALLWSRAPGLTFDQVVDQLKKTAKALPGQQLGSGRVDVMEAVFNGSFEQENFVLWKTVGTANSITALGPVLPRTGKRFGFVSSGPAGAQVSGRLTQSFEIQPGVTTLPIKFKYAFITEEYPEFVGSTFNDSMVISFTDTSGTVILKTESVNGSALGPVDGIDFAGGDGTVGWTTWRQFSDEIAVAPGPAVLTIAVEDAGDAIFDSAVVIDDIRFK